MNENLLPWRIWVKTFDKDGNLVGISQSVQTYERKGNAIRFARARYDASGGDVRFEWEASRTNPWA